MNTGGMHMNAVIFDMDGVLVDSERVVLSLIHI